MLAGTSTGGIIALGLASGRTAAEILDLYVTHGAAIFPRAKASRSKFVQSTRRVFGRVRSISRYRYDRGPLERQLNLIFGERILGELGRRIVVPSFDGYTEVNLFKTPHHPDYRLDWQEKIVDIALATSAAPNCFPVYKTKGRMFADGGVWANNPVMNGLVDALVCYKLGRRQVKILSLGCGDEELKITDKQALLGGLWHWKEIISSAMHLQGQNANGQAGLLIGRDQLLRLNPAPLGKTIELDDYIRAIAELPPLAKKVVDDNEQRLAFFFSGERPQFKAYHGPRSVEGERVH